MNTAARRSINAVAKFLGEFVFWPRELWSRDVQPRPRCFRTRVCVVLAPTRQNWCVYCGKRGVLVQGES